jgi:hypothetical protein
MGAVVWLLTLLALPDAVQIALGIPVGMVVYGGLLLLLRVLDATDIVMLRSVEENLSGKSALVAKRSIDILEKYARK